MQKLSPGQIGQLIREFFPPKDQTSPTGSSVTQLSVFNDFCQIGALLTDDVQCRMHLAALSKEMAQYLVSGREHEVGGPYRLNGQPVERFRQMPDYKTNRWRAAQLNASGLDESTDHPSFTSVYTDRSMWDFLCDAVPANNAMKDTTPASDSFRSSQFMNLHLTSPMSRDLGLLHAYLVARYNKRTWQFAKKLLRPYKKTLAAKWGLTEEEFDAAFSDSTKYGIEDVMATVDGKVAIRPERSHTQ